MSPNDLIGRRVRFAASDDLEESAGAEAVGTITHVLDHGQGSVEVRVKVEGRERHYTVDLDEVELLPPARLPFYTSTSPAHQGDRLRLYPSIEAARADAQGQPIYGVAVCLNAGGHRLSSLWTMIREIAPGWSTPAQLHHDGSVTAKGPIPAALFVAVGPPAPLLS
jgi:hypothetical protein